MIFIKFSERGGEEDEERENSKKTWTNSAMHIEHHSGEGERERAK